MSDGNLIPIESINAIDVFTGGKLDDLLAKIREETTALVPDVSTVAGRKEIASLAYKVARSKTTIDDAGKQLVADWKRQAGEVDAARKRASDYLDDLKDEIRRPLDDWEAEQERIAREKAEAEEAARQAEEAARLAEIERREAEIRAREEAIAKAEREAAEKAAAERAEKERTEREERIRQEAEERARREAAEAVERARMEAEAAKEAARLAAERAEQERVEAAAKAERDRQEAIRQAEQRAREEAEAKERLRAAEEARIKAEEERRAADREHRKTINNAALCALTDEGIDEDVARKVITLIASGQVPAVSIRY